MRNLGWGLALLVFMTAPLSAKADFIIEASVGSGFVVKPSCCGRTQTNVMIAPGWGIGEMLRAELGVLASVTDVENSNADIQLRPMIILDPPIIPFYGRAVFGYSVEAKEVIYGLVGGIGGSLFGLGLFGEVGIIPFAGATLLEGRAGAFIAFD